MAALAKEGYLVQSLRNSDFDCYSAYGEVIDNSVQAEAKKLIYVLIQLRQIGMK